MYRYKSLWLGIWTLGTHIQPVCHLFSPIFSTPLGTHVQKLDLFFWGQVWIELDRYGGNSYWVWNCFSKMIEIWLVVWNICIIFRYTN